MSQNYFVISQTDDTIGKTGGLLKACTEFESRIRPFFQLPLEAKKRSCNSDKYVMNSSANKQQYQIRSSDRYHYDVNEQIECLGEVAFEKCLAFCKSFLLQWIAKENGLDPVVRKGLEVALNSVNYYWADYSLLIATEYMNNLENCEDRSHENCRAHSDAGVITLCIAPENGLEIFDQQKHSWVPVSGSDKLVLFFGDSLASITGQVALPVVHRVVITESNRFSLVFKLRLPADVVGPRNDMDYSLLQKIQAQAELKYRQSTDLDQNTMENILLFLTPKDICNAELVSKYWQHIASSNMIWRAQCMIEFGAIGVNVISWKQLYCQKYQTKPKSMHLAKNFTQGGPPQYGVKLVVVGDAGVGKTSSNEFPKEYIPTVFDEYSTVLEIDGDPCQYSLWDTAGQIEYDKLRVLSYPGTNVVLILFDVSRRASFENVTRKWIPEIKLYLPKIPFILVGTKIDQREFSLDCTTYQQGCDLADEIGAVAYYEVSAKHIAGVPDVMTFGARVGFGKFPSPPKKKKNKCLVQ